MGAVVSSLVGEDRVTALKIGSLGLAALLSGSSISLIGFRRLAEVQSRDLSVGEDLWWVLRKITRVFGCSNLDAWIMSGSSLSFDLGLPFLGLYVIYFCYCFLWVFLGYRSLVNKTSVDKKKEKNKLYQ